MKVSGCYDPENCKQGRHDPEYKGKGGQGKPKGTPKGDPKGGGKGKKGKGKGDEHRQTTPRAASAAKLPPDAIKDANGKFLCYAYIHGKCTTDPCPKGRYHGPETPAMQKKRLEDEKKMKLKAEAGGAGTQTEVEDGNEKGPKPKGGAKTKAKAKPKAEP